MIKKRKIIMLPLGRVDQMARAHNVTRSTVYNALAYRSDSETAQLIRQQAVELYGGVETSRVVFQK